MSEPDDLSRVPEDGIEPSARDLSELKPGETVILAPSPTARSLTARDLPPNPTTDLSTKLLSKSSLLTRGGSLQ
jgi:hypothetical protein